MKRFVSVLAVALLSGLFALRAGADEGMWMINMLDKALERKMRDAGCKLPAKVIYDSEKTSLSDAIVSLDFGCTGSMISSEGLLITNHHCAYADIFALSTPEHNYLEDGFWARSREQEIPIPGKGAYFLRKVLDVTAEAEEIVASHSLKGRPMGSRKLCNILEKKYEKDFPGQEVALYSMYAGCEYYIMVYDKYTDLRLVAAPPVSMGQFGGDVDNWEWPQHKADFAIYRIYTDAEGHSAGYSAENVPMKPAKVLKINTKGVKEGDYTMVMGYPGITNRYASSAEVSYLADTQYPLVAGLMKERMDILSKWMNEDTSLRLKYSDKFFSLSNVQEIRESEAFYYKYCNVPGIYSAGREQHLSGALVDSIALSLRSAASIDRQIRFYQEACVRSGSMFRLGTMVANDADAGRIKALVEGIDMRVEKELFCLNIKELAKNIEPRFRGDALNEYVALYGEESLGERIWEESFGEAGGVFDASGALALNADSPVVRAVLSIKMNLLNTAKKDAEGGKGLLELKHQYKRALYHYNRDNGIVQYPDANSSMRLTYGNVTDLYSADAVHKLSHSTAEGFMQKYDPDSYDFAMRDDAYELIKKQDWGRWKAADGTMWINFITTNDITGGNSGSPVIDARGNLVGLAFDGNKEGLACDIYYDRNLNRCVCVDIRYVMWILEKYAGLDYLLEEILK